jgi:transcriptional regulator with XRE-family HTH domain
VVPEGKKKDEEDGRAAMSNDYAKDLGERLRRIRQQKGMSLQDVQQASRGRWKAAVVGAYERGDRNVTVTRLSELAEFYDVPITELLPEGEGAAAPGRVNERKRLILDLAELERVPESERDALARFTSAIQVQRGDFNGRVLTIREDDLLSLALLYQTTADELTNRLIDWGLLTH